MAAVVEYASPLLPNLSADKVMEYNAVAYIHYITEAANNNVSKLMVLFICRILVKC